MADYIKSLTVPEEDATYLIKENPAIHYAVCSTAAATAAKTIDLEGFVLDTGSWIAVKFTITNTAAVANLTLNVNNTGAKNIKYRNANLGSAGYLAANRIYLMLYDGTYWQVVGDINTNDNTYDRTSMQTRIYAGGVGVFPYSLCGLDINRRVQAFTTTGGTGTSKAFNTTAKFLYPPTIMYHNENETKADGAVVTNNVLYEQFPSANLTYSCNITTSAGFTQYKPVFLEAIMNEDGTWSPTSTGLTQTFTSGKYYILIGCMYNTSVYQLCTFAHKPMFYCDGGLLVGADNTNSQLTWGYCPTPYNDSNKTVTIPGFVHRTNALIFIMFHHHANVTSPFTLNINGTGAATVTIINNEELGGIEDVGIYWGLFRETVINDTNRLFDLIDCNLHGFSNPVAGGNAITNLDYTGGQNFYKYSFGAIDINGNMHRFDTSGTDTTNFLWPPKLFIVDYMYGGSENPNLKDVKVYNSCVVSTGNEFVIDKGIWHKIIINPDGTWSFDNNSLGLTQDPAETGYYIFVGVPIKTGTGSYYFFQSDVVVYYDGTNITPFIPHPSITTSADTTSSASPGAGNTFTAIDSVTRDSNGHVTTLNTKTVTLPAGYTHPTYTANTEFGYKYVTWDTIGSVTGGDYQLKQYRGLNNSTGWVKIAQLKITGTYINQPLKLRVVQRVTMEYDIVIRFAGANSKDPTLSTFKVYMDTPGNSLTTPSVYFNKTSTDATNGSTWDLYIKKLDGYDSIDILNFDFGRYTATRFEWTWYADGTEASEQPTAGNLASVVTYAYGDVYGGIYTRTLTSSNIDSQTGAFAFKGTNLIGGTADWAGIQLGYDNDMVQIVGGYNGLWVRQNDSGTWSNWLGLLKPNNVTAASGGGLTATITTTTAGTVDVNTGVSLGHSNSVTALTTSSLKKITYDANGHITASTDVQSADVSSLINLLSTGSSAPNLNDYYVCQYANGGTTTTSYYRRPISALWTTFKALITSATTGSGNAITAASISNDGNNRKITFTKGDTFLTTTAAANDYVTKANGTITTKLTVGTGSGDGQQANGLKMWTKAANQRVLGLYWSYGDTWGTEPAQVSYFNQYDGATPGDKGALLLLPYQTESSVVDGSKGLWLIKDHAYIDGVELSKVTHNHDGTYVPLTGSESMSNKFISVGNGATFGVQNTAGTYRIGLHSGSGSSGTNRGIYDWAGDYSGIDNWILYIDANNETSIYSTIKEYTSQSGNFCIPFFGAAAATGPKKFYHNNGLWYNSKNGTTTDAGNAYLVLGNSSNSTTEGNKEGILRLYSTNTSYAQIKAPSTTTARTLTLPNASGTLAINKSCMIYEGNDAITDSNGWYKFAQATLSATSTDSTAIFLISKSWDSTNGKVPGATGILVAHIRTDNSDKGKMAESSCDLTWLIAGNKIDVNHFKLIHYDTTTVSTRAELWCRIPERYAAWSIIELRENSRTALSLSQWTLYSYSGVAGTAFPSDYTGTVKISDVQTLLAGTV